ncbi:aspartate kinase [Fluviispira multicolorata]|uniref:Aspartokinase n=1 Tax=Fluviispira multicolorata TaxID=2654512 RepID=A0A833JAN5_9BACT|nr:aspartate kinase [Fluviispira multicolorata]KAB8028071.1 aspartate kinase [Fluviispira multicolorata]
MSPEKKCIVLKFGGASVSSPESFSSIADIILQRKKEYEKVIVVVSAMGSTTDDLISLAQKVNPNPPRRELDMLISVGERISVSLLAMALSAKGSEAISFTGSQSGILTTDDHSDAKIVNVKPQRLLPHLENGKIVIVAGFQGMSISGEITTLGRGGSDTTAVALAIALNAELVEFFKDVYGIYDKDPKVDKDAKLLSSLSYKEAFQIMNNGAKVLHARCVRLAEKNSLSLKVLPFAHYNEKNVGTIIHSQEKRKLHISFEI